MTINKINKIKNTYQQKLKDDFVKLSNELNLLLRVSIGKYLTYFFSINHV